MPKIVLPQKDPSEAYLASFDFTSYFPPTETITFASTTATVYSGTDPDPALITSLGSTTISGFVCTQLLAYGVNGVTYNIVCIAGTASGLVVTLSGYLAVLQNLL